MENTQEDEAKEAEIVKSIYSALVSLPKTESRAEILSELQYGCHDKSEYREHSVFPTLFFATFGCMASLVHEIILFYSEATFEKLSTTSSQRMQHVTGIVQSLAREKEICVELVHNNFISLLYPILNIIRVDSNLDIIQMAILGIIYDVVIVSFLELSYITLTQHVLPIHYHE
ncbi:hypothetical protein RF11_06831 [Thelohanellus kitauei]|uniref:CCR4-NOT transcription complex subunit 9 n=1 Tax=Thelohanellus kitauei TaxID=669202 RepID=A0A0C2JGK9_THEKT|nr:hypothetical protein RF11_06831 [Thelohanellus kitauei]